MVRTARATQSNPMAPNNPKDPIEIILQELNRAKQQYPGPFPTDPVYCAAIIAEEAGEVVKAALNYYYHNGTLGDLQKETAQTGAMVVRMLNAIQRGFKI